MMAQGTAACDGRGDTSIVGDARAGTGGVDGAPREATCDLVEVPGDRETS